MPRCFVPGCKSGYDSTRSVDKRHFFNAPRNAERLQQWERAIPRLDKKLSSSCSVCDLHFINDEILKVFERNIYGDIVVIPRDKWTLKDDAVPRLFPNCPSSLSKPTRKRRAPAPRRSPAQQKRHKKQAECVDAAVRAADDEASLLTDDSMPAENVFHVLSRVAKEGRKIREFVSADGRVVPRSVYAGKQTTEFKCMEDFTCLVLYVEQLKLCKGCPAKKYPKISSSVVATKHGETWRRNTCTALSVNATCAQCRTLEKLFLQWTKQQKDTKKKQAARLKLLRRKAIRATSRREKLKEEVVLMKRKLSAITEETIDCSLHILPARQQLAFKTAFMAAKAVKKWEAI
ncbi:uncharacterized protein LOC142574202 [Dermacentor variabilis]|uniref:uncharacterized protein LOC142574202 n=1 Tax=Dermacentor variabilis TaxID=34621 RepID=UPI003F5C1D19